MPLEDVNWAREILKDIDKRIRADVAASTPTRPTACCSQLTERYGVAGGQGGPIWQPLDNEKPLADYMPPAEVPNAAEVRAALVVPETPEETPCRGVAARAPRPGRTSTRGPSNFPPQDPTP